MSQLSALWGGRDERRQKLVDGAIDEPGPLVNPSPGLTPARFCHPVNVPPSDGEHLIWILDDATSCGVRDPLAPPLVSRQALRAHTKGFYISAPYSPVGADGREREFASLAKIDDVLAR